MTYQVNNQFGLPNCQFLRWLKADGFLEIAMSIEIANTIIPSADINLQILSEKYTESHPPISEPYNHMLNASPELQTVCIPLSVENNIKARDFSSILLVLPPDCELNPELFISKLSERNQTPIIDSLDQAQVLGDFGAEFVDGRWIFDQNKDEVPDSEIILPIAGAGNTDLKYEHSIYKLNATQQTVIDVVNEILANTVTPENNTEPVANPISTPHDPIETDVYNFMNTAIPATVPPSLLPTQDLNTLSETTTEENELNYIIIGGAILAIVLSVGTIYLISENSNNTLNLSKSENIKGKRISIKVTSAPRPPKDIIDKRIGTSGKIYKNPDPK